MIYCANRTAICWKRLYVFTVEYAVVSLLQICWQNLQEMSLKY